MPGLWNSSEATEGGLRGINKIDARLSGVDEDVEGKFGLQLALHFYDVEVLESADPIVLEDSKLTDWVKQSSHKGSANMAMVEAWEEFAGKNKLDWHGPSTFEDIQIIWEKVVVLEGNEDKGMSPARAWVPQEVVDKKAKAPARKRSATTTEEPADPEDATTPDTGASDLPAEVVTAIFEAVGEDGATRDLIRRATVTKAKLRKAVQEAGGLDSVLAALVEADKLVEDEGLYLKSEDDGEPF